MCSLHLTHPSAHTPGAVGTRHSGEQLGFGASLKAKRSAQCLPEPRFEPTTSDYKSNALSTRPRLPKFTFYLGSPITLRDSYYPSILLLGFAVPHRSQSQLVCPYYMDAKYQFYGTTLRPRMTLWLSLYLVYSNDSPGSYAY